jgi:hypothetical protein
MVTESLQYQDSGDYFRINPIDTDDLNHTLQSPKITRIKEEFNKDSYFEKVENLRNLQKSFEYP